mmetsp:Transcript_96051/g.311605  ORF Transcript_96051/g.311605 Transcript_96051/m.311605 type:complete len:122 (-) Transcript_96051:219-584(-)
MVSMGMLATRLVMHMLANTSDDQRDLRLRLHATSNVAGQNPFLHNGNRGSKTDNVCKPRVDWGSTMPVCVVHQVAGDVADVSAASQSALPSAQISAPLGDVGAMDGIGRQEDLDTSLAAKV